jgi:hypothetical protein
MMLCSCGSSYSKNSSSAVDSSGTAQVYPAASGEPLSALFTVSVNQQNSPVYLASVQTLNGFTTPGVSQTGQASFTSFDLSGSVPVSVIYSSSVQSAKILPS